MNTSVEINLATYPTQSYQSGSYDSTKLNLGSFIKQYTSGSADNQGVSPVDISFLRYLETLGIAAGFPYVVDRGGDTQWIFTVELTAGTNRRLVLYEFNKHTNTYSTRGFITVVNQVAGNITARGLEVMYETYTTGSVTVNGTAVTGSGTSWATDRLAAGSRIAFGVTNPISASTWYYTTGSFTDTAVTLTQNAGTIAPGTSYVIEDLRFLVAQTNATATNGYLLYVKGATYDDFTIGGTTITTSSFDNAKAVYNLTDLPILTATNVSGIAIDSMQTWQSQSAYVINATGARTYRYNLRNTLLPLSNSISSGSFMYATGNQTLTGTISQNNNGEIITLGHGPGSGSKSMYFATTTRIYRSDLSIITSGSTTWTSDVMVEIPPGGTATIPAGSTMQSVKYAPELDSLVINTGNGSGFSSYITRYNTTGTAFDNNMFSSLLYYNQSTADSNVPYPLATTLNAQMMMYPKNGYMHTVRYNTTAPIAGLYNFPYLIDYYYTDILGNQPYQVAITPAIDTSNVNKFYRVYLNNQRRFGSSPFTVPYEPTRLYYRTTGISDNTGAWTLLNDSYDLSGVSPSSQIQFKLAFKNLGVIMTPPKVSRLVLTYEDNQTDSHYEPSIAQSNIASRIFAWRQGTVWGSTIPAMRIRIYNIATNTLILEDTTSTGTSGTFEYSTDNGSNWSSWSSSADAIGNYIRYTATSLPSSTRTKVVLTQA